MAEGEEEKKKKSGGGDDEQKKISGGGGEKKKSGFPTGFRFTPSDEELVNYYLLPKLQGRQYVTNDAIIEANVYQCHPDKLIDMFKHRGEDSWYFLSRRARKYQNGDRPSRNTDDNRGRWKASTGKSEAKEVAGDGKIKYCESVLAYFEGSIKTEKKTKWLMHELTIPQYENKLDKGGGGNSKTLDEYVMCKIYVTPRRRGNDDEAGPSGTSSQEACPAPKPRPAVESGRAKLAERQAGKRPVEEEQPGGGATTPKRARQPYLRLGPTPPPPYGGMQVPLRAAGYYGGTGRSMVYSVRTPTPRPPVAYNGQTPVAFNGQTPVAFNGQVPVQQRQPVAYNGQVPVQQQQPVAYNGQVRPPVLKLWPPYRAPGTPNSCGQSQTMMTRPSNYPDGQAVQPPAVPGLPQGEKQPETEEMRKKRVYQQHLDELHRMQSQMQPPGSAAYAALQQRPMAFAQQQHHHQQPYFGADINHHHVGAMVPAHFPPYNYQVGRQYQCSWVVPATSDSGVATAPASAETSVSGAGNEGGGKRDCGNDDEKHVVESATMKTSPGASSSADGDGPRHDTLQ